MIKSEALQTYFENFGMDAYPFTAVPDDVKFPWLTYEYITSAFGDGDVAVTVNLWFRTESELIPNIRAEEFRQYIEKNDMIECDEGYIWVKPGSPWCQSLTDDADKAIKRRYINVTLEFLTK